MDLFDLFGTKRQLKQLTYRIEELYMKSSELVGIVNRVSHQLDKATLEITQAIEALRKSLEDVELSTEAADAMARLERQAQALDDINPDLVEHVEGEDGGEAPTA